MTTKEFEIQETAMQEAGARWRVKHRDLRNQIGEAVKTLMLHGWSNEACVDEVTEIVELASAQIEREAIEMGHPA